eukprot:TRINITY_DN973_c0_g1_i2.p1 TRINITY_DN973_c0_g1~~TRINITY_DN973_c0_g1_i2.p1  ORF type:complete len:391 (+),score=73.04 TRINITY_DN973_c0_g1_i2:44-1216(+)
MLNKFRNVLVNSDTKKDEEKKNDFLDTPTSRHRSSSTTTANFIPKEEPVTPKWGHSSIRGQPMTDRKGSDNFGVDVNKALPLNFLHIFRDNTQQMSPQIGVSTRKFSDSSQTSVNVSPSPSPKVDRTQTSPQETFTELVEGVFQQRSSKQRIYLYLLKDGLVYLPDKAKNYQQIENSTKWPLALVWFIDVPDPLEPSEGSTLFDIIGPDKVFYLKANTVSDKTTFHEALSQILIDEGLSLDSEVREGEYSSVEDPTAVYSGSWKMGQMHGKGRYKHITGVYDGLWENSVRSGTGVLRYSTGETYEGLWALNLQNGKGTLTYPGGDYYVGNWEGGKKSGNGDFVYASGMRYSGDWLNDLAHGRGSLTSKELTYQGEWKSGKVIYEMFLLCN